MPVQAVLFPIIKPLHLSARTAEELHLHLFELTHTENELTGNNLITECLTNLAYTKRQFHASSFLNIQVVHENTLCSFRTKVNFCSTVGSRSHFGREHKVELSDISPVFSTANRAYNIVIKNNLLEFVKVDVIHRFFETFMNFVTFSHMFKHTRVCSHEFFLIESIAKLLSSFFNLLIYLFIVLSHQFLDKNIGTITLLRIAVINKRVIKRIYVSRSLPSGRMHENSGIDTYNISV